MIEGGIYVETGTELVRVSAGIVVSDFKDEDLVGLAT
jgi:hypothetical protein